MAQPLETRLTTKDLKIHILPIASDLPNSNTTSTDSANRQTLSHQSMSQREIWTN